MQSKVIVSGFWRVPFTNFSSDKKIYIQKVYGICIDVLNADHFYVFCEGAFMIEIDLFAFLTAIV